ncbi:hypothetical protein BE20_28620 [Sorangium cellulosum]|uniref:Uncharacterized protein n=1 Tax=Sorangium cellulosum TaxID=56 RepID=A0A150RTZ5_SORCE|nr:hypothetical protein BE18_02690 [Sorangium cellulosum]KYF86573.1 hypothetical protein BE20_28620 [Sorangium cellulosum]
MASRSPEISVELTLKPGSSAVKTCKERGPLPPPSLASSLLHADTDIACAVRSAVPIKDFMSVFMRIVSR